MELPPLENPALVTQHLISVAPVARRRSLPTLSIPHLPWRFSALGAAIFVPVFFFWLGQPQSPQLSGTSKQLVSAYLNDSGRTAVANAAAVATPQPEVDPATVPAPTAAPKTQLASAVGPEGYSYQLTLAQGFLNKAIVRSQDTAAGQSETDRSAIVAFLQQALESANLAIDKAPTQGLGFLVRARIYKTASAVKPELGKLAEQDLTIARALGINDDALNDPNPLNHLPTAVAAPEEGKQASVSSTQTANLQSGRVVLAQGNRTIDVSFPGLSPKMSLRVDPVDASQNSQGAIFSVVSRTEGSGFTVQSSVPVTNDVVLEWRAIAE